MIIIKKKQFFLVFEGYFSYFWRKNREISHKTFSINNEKYEIIKLSDGLLKKAKEQDNLKEFIKNNKTSHKELHHKRKS